MTKFFFSIALATLAIVPATSMAQPDRDRDSVYYDQGPSTDEYSADRSWRDDRQDYDHEDYGRYATRSVRGVLTGRTGSSWRDAEGRSCQWREVARRDQDGYDAYKWIPVCD